MREKPVIILFMPAFDRLRGWPAPLDNSNIPGGRDEKTAGTQSKERTAAGHGEGAHVRNGGATFVVEGVGDHGCEYMWHP